MSKDATPFRYKAFVSYSWADAALGKWVHHAIETYRTPAALVGKAGRHGPVPARLNPVFKDREEEAAGGSIGAAVEAALGSSEFLVVVCSPRSAQSKWVNREIAWFKANRDPDKILALIIDGEPEDAFPPALTHRTLADLTVTDERLDDPLAADARSTGDGKRGARLKLAAAMLGVGLGELVDRDNRRRLVRQRIVVGASLALALVMSALALSAVRARDEADRQRAEADGLVEFMLTDLRDRLEPVGRLDALDVVGKRALTYYAQQDPGSLDADSLGRRSRALHLVGEVTNIRGDSAGGLVAFRQAARTTEELLARNPDDEQRIFDHAQSVFWVGYIAYERGENVEAERYLREYKALADRLLASNPRKKEWRLESSYAETNLGVMYDKLGRYPEAERAFAAGLRQIEAVAATEPLSTDRQIELGTMVNWLGKTMANLGKYPEAHSLNERQIGIYRTILAREPTNAAARNRLAVAMQYLGDVHLVAGDVPKAIDAYSRSVEYTDQLLALESGNTEWRQTRANANYVLAEALILARRFGDARRALSFADAETRKLVATDPSNEVWIRDFKARSLVSQMSLALAGANGGRTELTRQADRGFEYVRIGRPPLSRSQKARLLLVVGDLRDRLGQSTAAEAAWSEALAQTPQLPIMDATRHALLVRLDRLEDAARVAAILDRRGYRHPAFLQDRRINP